jgi:hypothetical protein
MSVFLTAKYRSSWAGLTSQNDQSVGKKKTTPINRARAYIKPLLLRCRDSVQKHPEIKHRYTTVKKRREHKKTISPFVGGL